MLMATQLWRTHTTVILITGTLLVIIASIVAFAFTTFEPRTPVTLGVMTYRMKVASDDTARQKGLSGVAELREDEGLLMAFPTDATWGIWMKDMRLPLDILWLDSQKKVVHIVKNAAPELSTSQTFRPTKPARYVIELPAGAVDKNKFKVGDVANFALPGEVL